MCPNPLRNIPSIHEILENPKLKSLTGRLHPGAVMSTMRVVLDEVTTELRSAATEKSLPNASELAERISRRVLQGRIARPHRAINATGTVLDDRLGEPPWADAAVEAMVTSTGGYMVDGSTTADHQIDEAECARQRLRELSGAEDALILNSASAAAMATWKAIAEHGELVIARRHVIRRGMDYDMATMARAVSVVLREVGAVNEVRADDYRQAMGELCGALLLVYRPDDAERRKDAVTLETLITLGHQKQTPVIHDLGPARLVDVDVPEMSFAPSVRQSIEQGADLALFSHELIGGPRCGMIVGRRKLIKKIEQHAIGRGSCPSRPTLAALGVTLGLLGSADSARTSIPLYQLLCAPSDNLKNRSERLAPQLAACHAVEKAEVVEITGTFAPWCTTPIPGWGVALVPQKQSIAQLAESLRQCEPAIVGIAEENRFVLNLRSVLAEQDIRLVEAIESLEPKVQGDVEPS